MDTRHCPICGEDRALEQPPCPDGHLDCPELACVECGAAIFGGWFDADAPAPAARKRTDAA